MTVILYKRNKSIENYGCTSEKETESSISETISSCEGTSVTDHTDLSSKDRLGGRKNSSDRKCSDSDERGGEETDRFDEDGDYESEDPVPKFNWKFREKGQELANTCEKQQTRIRLDTPHLGCNGGSTLSLIRKDYSMCNEQGKGNGLKLERISCYESIKKRLHGDKTSKGSGCQYQSDVGQRNKIIHTTKTSNLSVSDTSDVNKTNEVVWQRRLGEQNNEKSKLDPSDMNKESETGYGGISSQEDAHTFTHSLPQKRMSDLAESSVASKLARMTRLRQKEVSISTGKAFGSEVEHRVPLSSHKLGDSTTNTSNNRAVSSSECQQKVPSNIYRSGNHCQLFDHSCSVLCSDDVSNNKRSMEDGKSCAITSSDSSRKTVDLSNVPKKFLTTASFVQTYDDIFKDCIVSKDLSCLDLSNQKDFESRTLGLGLSISECNTAGYNQINSKQGLKLLKTTVDDSQIIPDKETENETYLGSKKDTDDAGINTKVRLLVGDGGAHFQGVPSESEADSMQDTMLFEGTPKSVVMLDFDRGDINTQDSSTDLLCYEEFDYAPTPQSNKDSYQGNAQQSYQTSNNSKMLTLRDKTFTDDVLPQYHQTCEGKTKNFTISPTLRETEGKSALTVESTESFTPCLASPEICSSNMATRGSDTPQSQGFVPISDMSSVMDKQVLDSVQESQGFVPVPAFTENRVISPAVSEGFSPVMMDDDLNVKLDSSSSNLRGSKRLCEDSDVTTVSSTNQGMETLAEYLDSYSSSIAELYEEDMSYVKKKKLRSNMISPNTSSSVESSEHTKSLISDVTQDNGLPGVSSVKSQSDLSNSFPTQLTNEIFKTQAHFRQDSDSSISDKSNLTLDNDHCRLYDGEGSRAFAGNTGENAASSLGNGFNIEVSSMIDIKGFPDKGNLDSLSSDKDLKCIESMNYRQQSVSQLEKSGYMSKNVRHVVMSDEVEGCIQCESIQNSFCNSTNVVADSSEKNEERTAVLDSVTETTSNTLDNDNCQVTQSKMESFQKCCPIQDTDNSEAVTDIFSRGNMADRILPESTLSITNLGSTTSDKSKEFGISGLTSKQLKVLRGSNRKGKLPVDICCKSQEKTTDLLAKTDGSADIGQWSDVDEEDLVAVTENGQTCTQQSQDLHNNKTDNVKDTCEQPWVEMEDPKTGEKLYVNSITGHNRPQDGSWEPPPPEVRMTSSGSTTPSVTNTMLNDLSPNSHNTLLHMMSEHLESMDKEEEDLLSVKWAGTRCSSERTEESQEADSIGTKCVEDLLENWENPVFARPEQAVAAAVEASRRPRGSARVHGVLHSHKFTKDMLQNVTVIGQVDNKFIACMTSSRMNNLAAAPNLMLLFDQHAAHERVRLEKLTKEAYDGDNRICCSTITPAKCLTLEEEEVRVMVSYREEFSRIGVTFTADKQERDSILVHTIPACIMQKEVTEVKRKRESIAWNVVLNLLKEHVEMLMSTSGVLGRLPATLHKVLCSQACHGAIKFGDQLSVEECKELLVSLSLCDLPFQCAHGRPSIMPLLELDKLKLNHKTKKPNLWKISKQL
ncbi:uncharacterized protein LOC117324223 [Pecten maximus]|uniref:uncharacterized protein LOC117324223 n=1 Tax=Pecten maximus TaxID=6579 RepID=UPI001457F9CE|nr:uncharacterized protein LOC117324223 [Pecten maximus]